MTATARESLQELATLIEPAKVEKRARRNEPLSPVPLVNAHIHLPPNFSAFETVEQAVTLAHEQKIGVLGVSNYYDFEVYGEFIRQARKRGIYPLFGLEIIALDEGLAKAGIKVNDPGNPGKMYICGKGITKFIDFSPRAKELIDRIRANDAERTAAMICHMESLFAKQGMPMRLSHDAVVERIMRRHGSPRATVHIQERHICQAFQEVFFKQIPEDNREAMLTALYGVEPKANVGDAVATQNELRSHLMKAGKPAYVPERFLTPAEARELALELGGIPCYPTLADGVSPICGFETPIEKLISNLREHGFKLAEFIPLRNRPQVLQDYVMAIRKAGIVVTAGTEHNTLDLVPIAPECVGGEAIPPAVQEIFWEGACVVAAHQYLTLLGKPGYVDAEGKLNSAYGDDELRIGTFRQIGEAVIGRYFDLAARES